MAKDALKHLHYTLRKKGKTVSVAESCTGGIISGLLTQLPGSSQFFILGIVTYNNTAKAKILGISPRLIAKKGAVSGEVAQRMAISVRKLSGADFGIGITGIAGPGGATTQQPLGTVFIAIASKKNVALRKFKFSGDRPMVRKKSARKALEMLGLLLDKVK